MRGRGDRPPPRQGPHPLTPADRHLRRLLGDGFEHLGPISLGTTLVIGDPSELLAAPGSGRWHGTAVRPGSWHALGRPAEGGGDALVEVVLVHEGALAAFWDLYDDAVPVAAFLLPTHRVLAVDGGSRTDVELLRQAAEPEELPWLLDHGVVAAAVQLHPAQVWQPKAPGEVSLVAVALDRAPSHQASSDAHQSSPDRDDD